MAIPPADGTGLAPHYYLDNFLVLCDTVEDQYGDLLAEPERDFLAAFRAVPFKAQCLYVRLVSRVGPWFRESGLSYAELGAIPPLVDHLLAAGLAGTAAGLTPAELGALFTRAELQQAFAAHCDPAPRGKAALLEAIAELGLAEEQLLQATASIDPQRVIGPCDVEQVQLLQLLFFGNRRQSLTEFVLSDLGVARYYPYTLDRQHRLFPRREALEEYLACAALGDCWYELRDSGDVSAWPALAAELLALEIRFPSSEGRWHRLCNAVARDLERQGELALAGRLYAVSGRHPARERRLRILEREADWHAAEALASRILDEPWCEEERDAAERVLPRLQRRLGARPAPRQRDAFSRLDLQLPRGEASVEVLAAQHLATRWAAVHYVENTLMNALFGLAFWEQIFAPVPGAFHNPFQSVPTDMYSPDFRRRRRAGLEARLAELRRADLGALLRDAYDRYAPCQCRWVDWRRIDPDLLAHATAIIPVADLLAVWERMLFDPGENRRGFPDLLALGDEPGAYCLIEVKGPGDALQDSQKRWLRFFQRQGIPAAVAWVSWDEVAHA